MVISRDVRSFFLQSFINGQPLLIRSDIGEIIRNMKTLQKEQKKQDFE